MRKLSYKQLCNDLDLALFLFIFYHKDVKLTEIDIMDFRSFVYEQARKEQTSKNGDEE
ncbi:MAG: hypothetical protein M0R17_10960 [Candidatus Omnitrophica bacterium]|jgi:hypothetical protein|nr:hypothetical protein [Candidatus Omnitrophota bacterium]